MATAKKTTRLSVARISKPSAEKAVPRGGVKAVSLKSSKGTPVGKKPAVKKPESEKTAPEKPSAKRPASVTDEGAKLILKELRVIRDTLARHDEMLAQITERLITPEAPPRDRGKAEARTSDARGAPDVQDQESGELP